MQLQTVEIPVMGDPLTRWRLRLTVLWYCRIRGLCICCGGRISRRGEAQGVCDGCLGVERDALGAYLVIDDATYPVAR